MQIIPSVLEYNVDGLNLQINRLSKYFSRFQIDTADGIYVDNTTIQTNDIVDYFKKSLINFKNLIFDFHFMTKNYENDIRKINELRKIININYIFVHYNLFPNLNQIKKECSLPIGLVFNPQDQINDLSNHYSLNEIPFFQIMSIVPGAQGKPFIPETLNKIEQLRDIGYRKEIFLDGAVNEKTIPVILAKKYQPDFICPGSFLTKAKNLEKNVKYLNKL